MNEGQVIVERPLNHVIRALVRKGVPLPPRTGAAAAVAEQLIGMGESGEGGRAQPRPLAEDAGRADPSFQAGADQRRAQVGRNLAQEQGHVTPPQAVVEALQQPQEGGVGVPRPLEDQDHHADVPLRPLLHGG